MQPAAASPRSSSPGAEAYRVLAGVEEDAALDGASCAHVLEYLTEELMECKEERVSRRP